MKLMPEKFCYLLNFVLIVISLERPQTAASLAALFMEP